MTLRVGVIGTGAMGADHVRTLSTSVPGARLTRVFDPDLVLAATLAESAGAHTAASGLALIESDDVDAVIVASPDATHPELVIAGMAVGKPVLCEKPLAASAAEAWSIVADEITRGVRLVQVGFMRRFDPGFVELKSIVSSGRLGEPRLVHNVHRNASDVSVTGAELVTGSLIHEIDGVPWLLDDRIDAIRVESPIVEGFQDPLLVTFRMASGVLADVEVFVNARYGYDVRCEVVGTYGSASLAPRRIVETRLDGTEGAAAHPDFVTYFADAYRLELSRWVRDVRSGAITGPTAWDGYVTNLVADAGLCSLTTGEWASVDRPERPPFYGR